MTSSNSQSSNRPLKIVFAGTPDFAASVLQSILDEGHQVCAVYCQPDRRVGRGKKLAFGPVKSLAVSENIRVEQPIKFDQQQDEHGDTPLQKLISYQPDLMIVVAYGLILPEAVLSVAKYGCINIHASLLPRWRGAAPIQRAIQRGDPLTGVTIMQMDKGLDTGNMLLKQSCEILPTDTGSSLHDKLAVIGSTAINEFLASFGVNKGSSLSPGENQDNQQANYAHKLNKAEAEIDWSESAATIERKIRAFNAWPVCFSYIGEHRLRIWQAKLVEADDRLEIDSPASKYKAGDVIEYGKQGIVVQCGNDQSICLQRLQADGSRAMSAADLLNSKSSWFEKNARLSSQKNSNDPQQ